MARLPDLGKMVGPLPLGAWVAAVGGSLVVATLVRRRQAAAADDVPVLTSGQVPYPYDPQPLQPATYGGVWGLAGAPSGPPATPTINTNTDWERAASTVLIGKGYEAYATQQALRAYLRGLDPLTPQQQAIVEAALQQVGLPPQPPTAVPPAPPPTNPAPTTPTTPIPNPWRTEPAPLASGGQPQLAAINVRPGPRVGAESEYITLGMVTTDVGHVHAAMRLAGYNITDPPNTYGYSTQRAVAAFQARYDLSDGAAGVVGNQTWAAISEVINGPQFRSVYA